MAKAARLDFPAYRRRSNTALRVACLGNRLPGHAIALIQKDGEPFQWVFVLIERPPTPLTQRPIDVPRAFTVACLAADADFRPGGVETVAGRVVVFLHAGRMTLGAHEIPVLVEPGPVQHVVVLDLLIRIEMKPALAALILGPAVPGDRKRLDAAIRELDQVLLEGIDAKGVLHLEGRKLAVGAAGLDEEFVVLLEKARVNAVVVKT